MADMLRRLMQFDKKKVTVYLRNTKQINVFSLESKYSRLIGQNKGKYEKIQQ